jgi:hypothetical protein
MKKPLLLGITILLLFSLNLPVNAQEQPEIKIIMVDKALNLEYLNCDVNTIIENNYTLVPIRAIAEKLGFKVEWDSGKQSIKLYKGNSNLILKIGSESAIADSKNVTMPISPKIVNNRTFIPLRYVAEFFNQQVRWLEGIDSKDYIWISDIQLLNDSDVDVPKDTNYYVLFSEPAPYYALKKDGNTFRGVKIGDDYSSVIEKYGEPHKKIDYAEIIEISYVTPGLPNSGSGSTLIFNIKNNKVDSV